jgi:hypothetical protein
MDFKNVTYSLIGLYSNRDLTQVSPKCLRIIKNVPTRVHFTADLKFEGAYQQGI